MAIPVICPSCQASLSVKDEFAGKRGRCPKCTQPIEVPEQSAKQPPIVVDSDKKNKKPRIPPATERQKEYATELGVAFDDNINRKDISELIDDAVERRDDDRYRRMDELQRREGKAYEEIREELLKEVDEEDPRVSSATLNQIMAALGERNLAAVLITLDEKNLYDAVEGNAGTETEFAYTEDWMTEGDMWRLVANVGVTVFKQKCMDDDD